MHTLRNSILTLAVAAALAASVLAGCSSSTDNSAALNAQATVNALSTANAQLSTQVAALAASHTPTPAAAPAQPAPVSSTSPLTPTTPSAAAAGSAAAHSAAATGGPLPALVANVPLAPAGQTIYDLRVDRPHNRIYVTDTAGKLHILDATTYQETATLPFGGQLELDPVNGRLYVFQPMATEADPGTIHVIDANTLQEVGKLAGRALAVDAGHNRLFVGEPYYENSASQAAGVRIVDGVTLQQTGVFTQPGAPAYNAERDEVLITAYTVYAADPKTQQITGDLFPALTDLSQVGFLWCNGCRWVDKVQVFPQEKLIGVWDGSHCVGKGCGVVEPPTFYDAATMQPVDPALAPAVQADCGSSASLLGAVQDRRYVNQLYDRYVAFTNFHVNDANGAPLTLRDGLRTEYINPRTNQGYLYDGLVIDMATLAPLGTWPAACVMADEADTGLIFGRRGGSLYVIAERGARAQSSAPPAAGDLPARWVTALRVSPNFAADQTVLAELESGLLYRSTDGGATWARLADSIPSDSGQFRHAFFSPNYGSDKTIYLTGSRGDYWGDGVWRSTDGGATWEALWNNLVHRRGEQIYFSPTFADDHTLVLLADFHDIDSGRSGQSYQQSTDGGLTWTLVVTGNYSTPDGDVKLPPVSELLPGGKSAAGPELNVRLSDIHDAVLYTLDGATWQTATIPLQPVNNFFSVLASPNYAQDRTVYAASGYGLWRSTDGGATWEQWEDARLAAQDPKKMDTAMHSAAVSPRLADGGYRLFVGAMGGQVWVLDPAAMTWKKLTPAVAAVLPTPTPTTAAAGPAAPPAAATAEAAPTATAAGLAGEPPAGLFRPEGSLAVIWESTPRVQHDLGWAKQAGPNTVGAALERFENGSMVWRQDTGRIYVFFNDGTWQSYQDTFVDGQPESDPALKPPAGKLQPVRGFGKVWRSHGNVRDRVGWALSKEEAWNAQIHPFEHGAMIRLGGAVFTLVGEGEQGKWY